MSFRFAVDFDGTLFDTTAKKLDPQAVKVLRLLKDEGHSLVLFSARATTLPPFAPDPNEESEFYKTGHVPQRVREQWAAFEEMRQVLQVNGLWSVFDEVWQSPGKPFADYFIDDRNRTADWVAIAQEFGVSSPNGL